MQNVTIDDVYDIATEVCEEMITKFLQNLVQLVPTAEDTIDAIEEEHYRAHRAMREGRANPAPKRRTVTPLTIPKEEDEEVYEEEEEEEEEDEIAALAHPKTDKLQESFLNDTFINSLPTECDGLPGAEQGIGIDPAIDAMAKGK